MLMTESSDMLDHADGDIFVGVAPYFIGNLNVLMTL